MIKLTPIKINDNEFYNNFVISIFINLCQINIYTQKTQQDNEYN